MAESDDFNGLTGLVNWRSNPLSLEPTALARVLFRRRRLRVKPSTECSRAHGSLAAAHNREVVSRRERTM